MANSPKPYHGTSQQAQYLDIVAIYINLGFDLPAAREMAAIEMDKVPLDTVASQKDFDEDQEGDYR